MLRLLLQLGLSYGWGYRHWVLRPGQPEQRDALL